MAAYLIAGAAGYVGSRLARRLLAQGHSVRGLVRNPESDVAEELAARGMVVWTGDVTRPDSLVGVADGISYVYNLTSRLAIENGSLRATFVDGNQNLIAACSRAHTVRSYIFTSSDAPYGNAGEELIDEDAPTAGSSHLSQVMIAAEQTILDLVRKHHFPAMILRVGRIYGPERDPIDALLANTVSIYGDGRNYISRIHIDDLLAVLELAATHGQPGAIYNVCDDEPTRQIDLYGEMRRRLGMVPPRTIEVASALNAGIDPSVVSQSVASVLMSNARLKHDLGIALRYPSSTSWLDERLGIGQEQAVNA